MRTHYLEANIIINPNYVTLLPQFYGYLSQQQNMLQDYVRTSTYQRAILDNHTDFDGKIVLDVGAGSGTTFLQKSLRIWSTTSQGVEIFFNSAIRTTNTLN